LEPDANGFSVPTTEVSSRFALSFKALRKGTTLKLAKLYGTALLRLGGNGELSGTAAVLFERGPTKRLTIRMDQNVPLHHHPDYLAAEKDLGVTLT
jgi:hypothetical protein